MDVTGVERASIFEVTEFSDGEVSVDCTVCGESEDGVSRPVAAEWAVGHRCFVVSRRVA